MKLVQQRPRFEVRISHEEEKIPRKHGILLPGSIRGVICGPSGCGKTCIMINLLYHQHGLRFENVYLFSKTLFQKKYQKLEEVITSIPGMCYTASSDSITPLSDVKLNSVLIFDDVACESQVEIRNTYCMGRHKGVDCFYLTQTYTAVPKHLLRDNLNFIILFKQDYLNLKHVFEDHVAGDMNFSTFQKLCAEVWKEPFNFLVIAKDFPLNEGRYRKGFDTFFENINT